MANNDRDNSPPADSARPRRDSYTAQTFSSIFGRSNSIAGPPAVPGPTTTAAAQDQRRRMSISTLGLSGTSPTQPSMFPFANRRESISTAGSDSIDENAIDDDDGPASRSTPTTPFVRRMSFGAQALRTVRTGGSPGTTAEGGFNWSEQLRSRAESSVSQSQRPTFSTSPSVKPPMHERSKSVVEIPTPAPAVKAPSPRPIRQKPDAFQERILKGDFYMD